MIPLHQKIRINKMTKLFQVKIYQPTDHKGLRFRIKELSNKFISFDYFYNSVLDQALNILKDHGYSDDQILNVKWIDKDSTYYIATERY